MPRPPDGERNHGSTSDEAGFWQTMHRDIIRRQDRLSSRSTTPRAFSLISHPHGLPILSVDLTYVIRHDDMWKELILRIDRSGLMNAIRRPLD